MAMNKEATDEFRAAFWEDANILELGSSSNDRIAGMYLMSVSYTLKMFTMIKFSYLCILPQ
jgi:hypothetical protein